MIAIDDNFFVGHFCDNDNTCLALGGIGLKLVADFNIFFRNLGARNANNKLFIKLAIGVFGRNKYRFFIAFFKAFKRGLKPLYDLTAAFEIAHWFFTMR